MKPGLVFVYSNAISDEKEAEYNEWYNGIHAEECCVPGVRRLKRYKLADTAQALKDMASRQVTGKIVIEP